MTGTTQIVVVDDDDAFRDSLCDLLRSLRFDVRAFVSAEDLLGSQGWLGASCLLVDASMPGATGMELQLCLRELGSTVPIVFVTGYEDRALQEHMLAGGAVACLCKPFEEEQLLSCLDRALRPGG